MAFVARDTGSSAAKRRRERRLRSWLRHERMTVTMALAESTHHSSRGQTNARAGVWGREVNHTATTWDPRTHTHQPELFSLFEEEPGGTWPDRMRTLSGPQEQVLGHTMDQIVDAVLSVPILDDPAPQMVEQLQDIMSSFDTLLPVPEQVIEVPKIFPVDVPVRTTVRDTQLAEQLVEVPTIVSLVGVLSSPFTFQFALGVMLVDVFKVFSLA